RADSAVLDAAKAHPGVRPVWSACQEAAIPALPPFLDVAGTLCGLRWLDEDPDADHPDGRMADANLEHLPALPDAGAGRLAGREPLHPVAVFPASACPADRGTVDAAGSVSGAAAGQCRPDGVPSEA